MRTTALQTVLAATLVIAPLNAFASNYMIHLSGMCSKDWTGAGGFTPGAAGSGSQGGIKVLGQFSGWTSINAAVDQQQGSLSTASSQLKSILDTYCLGSNSCWIFNYSAGDLVLGYTFAHSSYSWNIQSVDTVAGAAGGSNLAGTIASQVACAFANNLTESNARNAYVHDNGYNGGTTIYRAGGNKHMTISNVACVAGTAINLLSFGLVNGGTCLQHMNDGAVAYQSSGAYESSGDYSYFWRSSDPSGTHWRSHASFWVTGSGDVGDNLNHYNMKGWLICYQGGISGYAAGNYTNCFNWASTQ